VEVQLYSFLMLALDGGEWSASHTDHCTPRERPLGIHRIGGWVGPWVSLEKRKPLAPARIWTLDHPTRGLVTILTILSWLFTYYLKNCLRYFKIRNI
jgi:hypothetical protein